MRKLLVTGAIAARVARHGRRRHRGRQHAASAAQALALPGPVRHLRPRRRPARLPGLSRGLRGLPFAVAAGLPQPDGARADREPGQGPDQGHPGSRPQRRRPADRAAGAPVGPLQEAVPQRGCRGRRQQRQGAARPQRHRQGARERPGLHPWPADRLRAVRQAHARRRSRSSPSPRTTTSTSTSRATRSRWRRRSPTTR